MAISAPGGTDLNTAFQTIYTCPPGLRVVVELNIANFHPSLPVNVLLYWTDASAGGVIKTLLNIDIAAKDAIVPKRKVLEPGDALNCTASANFQATVSVDIVHTEPVP